MLALLTPLAGGEPIISSDVVLKPGKHIYQLGAQCLDGCRLSGLNLRMSLINPNGDPPQVTLNRVISGDGKTVTIRFFYPDTKKLTSIQVWSRQGSEQAMR